MNCIVTTTISSPTEATIKFCNKSDWDVIIVGDLKTPHDEYKRLAEQFSNVRYLSPQYQEEKHKEVSDAIGWNCIGRRNIGFIEAYNNGAQIIATVDDDNIPYKNWGEDVLVNKDIIIDSYSSKGNVFDPLSVTKNNHLWHRGFPIELLREKNDIEYEGKVRRRVLVEASLWDGAPDVDAIARMIYNPIVKYSDVTEPYCSSNISPFNSQNTLLSREVFPYYACPPHMGRMDDIWGGYILQHYLSSSVVYSPATVYQDRNVQDTVTNLEDEVIGYRGTLGFINGLDHYDLLLPPEVIHFYDVYKKAFKQIH